MATKMRVWKSINDDQALRCVDIFIRPDGTCGFEEYRRDVEDNRGWFAVGSFANQVFPSPEEACSAAKTAVAWLDAAPEFHHRK